MADGSAVRLEPRQLFGGAIQMDLPAGYIDASDLRQIPDSQEVFLSHDSETSVVLEVLDMVEEGQAGKDLWEAVKFHFDSIAHDNSSLSSQILTPPPAAPVPSQPAKLPAEGDVYTPEPVFLVGTQTIHKFSHDPTGAARPGHESDTPDQVWIGVALWRCWVTTRSEGMEMVSDGPSTGAADADGAKELQGVGPARQKKADLVLSVNVNLSAQDGRGAEEQKTVEEWWLRTIGSLRVADWNLFGDV